eukprot:TRINITY_DN27702_c0_g1_i1.p1 TRINITY_DN27702_c0_g1~~TRINITY_DN27702_c0_g1_i1.p1  ORF type:complete len:462 (+),score=78.38 TRINITY_DN27702_c0_g1_i1:232-1617(+)
MTDSLLMSANLHFMLFLCPRGMVVAACIACLLHCRPVQAERDADVFLHEDDTEMLNFSLLQTSLQLVSERYLVHARESAKAWPQNISVSFVDLSSLPGARARLGREIAQQLHRPASLLRTLLDEPSALNGIPALVVLMLAAVVMVVCLVQFISIAFEEQSADSKCADQQMPRGSQGVYNRAGRPASSGDWRAALVPGPDNPYSEPLFGPDGQEYSTMGTLLPATLPLSARPSLNAPAHPNGAQSFLGGFAAQGSSPCQQAEALRTGSLSSSPAARPDVAAMCPNLILPFAEAQFSVPADNLAKLVRGFGPVSVLGGQTGRPLLHARFDSAQARHQGAWLQLSTVSTSRFPHCSAGPLQLNGRSSQVKLEIHGPKDCYGTLEETAGVWYLRRVSGELVMSFSLGPGGVGLAAKVDGQSIAIAEPEGDAALRVQVTAGKDPLLTLICMLAILVVSPTISGLSH